MSEVNTNDRIKIRDTEVVIEDATCSTALRIVNSNETYDETINPQEVSEFPLPNIIHTNSDGEQVELPAQVAFIASLCGIQSGQNDQLRAFLNLPELVCENPQEAVVIEAVIEEPYDPLFLIFYVVEFEESGDTKVGVFTTDHEYVSGNTLTIPADDFDGDEGATLVVILNVVENFTNEAVEGQLPYTRNAFAFGELQVEDCGSGGSGSGSAGSGTCNLSEVVGFGVLLGIPTEPFKLVILLPNGGEVWNVTTILTPLDGGIATILSDFQTDLPVEVPIVHYSGLFQFYLRLENVAQAAPIVWSLSFGNQYRTNSFKVTFYLVTTVNQRQAAQAQAFTLALVVAYNQKTRQQMDVVYILGKGSKWNNNELRFTLRAMVENLKGFWQDIRCR